MPGPTKLHKRLWLVVVSVLLVLGLMLPTSALAEAGTWVGSIQVMNIGGATANVTVTFYNQDGTQATTASNNVAPGSSWNIYTPSVSGLTPGFVGSVIVSSNQPVVAIGSENVTYPDGSIGVSQYSGMGASEIGTQFYLPNVNKQFGASQWSTRITIQNATSAANRVTVYYYDADGNEVTAARNTVDLSGYGSVTFRQAENTGLRPGWLGSAVVSGTGNLAVVVDVISADGRVETYNGVKEGATTLYIPTLLKGFGSNKWNSSFQVFNPSATETATLTINYYTAGNPTPTKTDSGITLGPRRSSNYYLPSLAGIPDNWLGSVTIQSDKPVVAVASQSSGAPGTNKASIYNAFSAGSTTAYLPTILRNFGSSNYVTSFQIMNVSSSPASVTVEYFAPGNPTPVKTVRYNGSEQPKIQPFTSVNRYQPDVDPELGTGWQGSVKVTSDVPVVVVGSQNALARTGDTVGQYGGFAVP